MARTSGDEDSRTVRVFISSTFLDMQDERDELVRHTFPALRNRFRARGVELVEVDLRWGVTREDVESGRTLPICLIEIDRCKPYFIALLGERYGTVLAHEIPNGLADVFPVLKDSVGRSLTEIEIMHAVMRDPSAASQAWFFERDPAWLNALTVDDRAKYMAGTEQERANVLDLRKRIHASGAPVVPYARPRDIGAVVEGVLAAALEARFPETGPPDATAQSRCLQEAFARERRRGYVGGRRELEALDAWMVRGGEKPMLVIGPPGAGKSSLVANFVAAYRERHPGDIVLSHYIGASPDSASSADMVHRLIDEIKRAVSHDHDACDDEQARSWARELSRLKRELEYYDPDPRLSSSTQDLLFGELMLRLAQANAYAGTHGIMVLVAIDGLDKFVEPHFRLGDLWWLPDRLGPRVKFLMSCVDGGGLRGLLDVVVESPAYEKVTVGGIGEEERRALVTQTLERWGKKLSDARMRPVLAHRLAAMPMFLQLVLEELRLNGVEGHLDERLDFYLQARDMPGLFSNVIERLEQDCGAQEVKAALCAMWASRAGLAEDEIRAIAQMPPLGWAKLQIGLGFAFSDQLGRVTLGDRFLQQAVMQRYVSTDRNRGAAHLTVATYFSSQWASERAAEELPFQLRAAEAWAGLAGVLGEPGLFVRCVVRDHFEMEQYWLDMTRHGFNPVPDLVAALRKRHETAPQEAQAMAGEIAGFFGRRGEQRYSSLFGGHAWRGVERAKPDIIAVREAPPPPALPVFKGIGQRSTSRKPFEQGPDWFLFQPGDRWLQIRCPRCGWEDVWDRGEEQAPPRCPSCGFGARSS